jgi:hypothetical protein
MFVTSFNSRAPSTGLSEEISSSCGVLLQSCYQPLLVIATRTDDGVKLSHTVKSCDPLEGRAEPAVVLGHWIGMARAKARH